MSGLLTIDVGGTSAWAAGAAGSKPEWGHHRFTPTRRDEFIPEEALDCFFDDWVTELFDRFRPSLFAIENPWLPRDPRHLSNTVFRIVAMSRRACAIAHRRGLKPHKFSIGEVAAFYGAGKMRSEDKKAKVKHIIETQFKWSPVTTDESDALAVWAYTEARLTPEAAAKRGIGDLFTAEAMAPRKTRAKRAPREPELGLL